MITVACEQAFHLWLAKREARGRASEWRSRKGQPSHSRLLSRAALTWLLATWLPQMESLLAGYDNFQQHGCHDFILFYFVL